MKDDPPRTLYDKAGYVLFGTHVVILLGLMAFVPAMLVQTPDPLERDYLLIPAWAGVGYVLFASLVSALLYRRRSRRLSGLFFGAAAVAAIGGVAAFVLHLWIKTQFPG